MAHHLEYIQLAWYIGMGLGAFRLISQFVIKMIAIFAREKFSDRAFEVLTIRRTAHTQKTLETRQRDHRSEA
jgi:hypothetical protein